MQVKKSTEDNASKARRLGIQRLSCEQRAVDRLRTGFHQKELVGALTSCGAVIEDVKRIVLDPWAL